jgi:putative phosphoesterase
MRIGVFSDTHLIDSDESIRFLINVLEEHLSPVDMILHAGDLEEPGVLKAFEQYPIHIVKGNMDPPIKGIPKKKIIRVGMFNIGLVHGDGMAVGIDNKVRSVFGRNKLDCVVYGHTHKPACFKQDGVLFFNPGSATDKRDMEYHSVGLLEIGDDIQAEIIRLD